MVIYISRDYIVRQMIIHFIIASTTMNNNHLFLDVLGVMHQSAASPWGRLPGALGDLSKRPFKPHQIPLGIGQRNTMVGHSFQNYNGYTVTRVFLPRTLVYIRYVLVLSLYMAGLQCHAIKNKNHGYER